MNQSEVIIIEIEVTHNMLNCLFEIMLLVEGLIELLYVHPSVRQTWLLMKTLVQTNNVYFNYKILF